MYLGQIVEKAPAVELFEQPQHPYTKALLSAIPVPSLRKKREIQPLTGEISSPIDPPNACRFAPRCPMACAKCTQGIPTLKDVGGGHQVACFLYE